jgi:DNA-binding MarR family transcriptional regulator
VVVSISDQSVHLQAWRALLRAQASLADQLERELLAAVGLPLAWYEVLLVLDRAPEGALRLQHLLATVLMTKSGVSRLIDRMEEAGLVRRAGCPSDRRGAFAVITDAGREKLRLAAPIHAEGIDRHLAQVLDPEQALALRDALTAVADTLGDNGRVAACLPEAASDPSEPADNGANEATQPTMAPRDHSTSVD